MTDENNANKAATITNTIAGDSAQNIQTSENTEFDCNVCQNKRYLTVNDTNTAQLKNNTSAGRMAPCFNCFFKIFSPFFVKNLR